MENIPSNCNHFEDPKITFRPHSFMQEYQELHMVPTLFFFDFSIYEFDLFVFESKKAILSKELALDYVVLT